MKRSDTEHDILFLIGFIMQFRLENKGKDHLAVVKDQNAGIVPMLIPQLWATLPAS